MPEHLALPIRLAGVRLACLAQDSPAEVAQSLALLVATAPGERRSVPDYGVPSPLFGGLDVDAIVAAAAEWEPRADPVAVERVGADLAEQQARLFPAREETP